MKAKRKPTDRKIRFAEHRASRSYSGLKPSMRGQGRPPWPPPDVPDPPVAFGGFGGAACPSPIAAAAAAWFGAAAYDTRKVGWWACALVGGAGCFAVFACYFIAPGWKKFVSGGSAARQRGCWGPHALPPRYPRPFRTSVLCGSEPRDRACLKTIRGGDVPRGREARATRD
jgi:hypothetical protein